MEDFKNCRSCGTLCKTEFKFCPNCGANMEDSKCLQCGAELIEGAKFCVSCGATVNADTVAVESQETDTASVNDEVFTDDVDGSLSDAAVSARMDTDVHSKPAKAKNGNKNFIIRLFKNLSVLTLCVILFALSFCNIVTVKVDDSIMGGLGIENCSADFSSIDIITIMCASSASDEAKDKLKDEFTDIKERLMASVKNDYNDRLGKVVLSARSKKLISDYTVCYMKYMMMLEENQGSPSYANMILAGIFCLLNIMFSAAMLIVGSISVALVLLKKKNKVSKYLYAMPIFLFMSLLVLFVVKTTFGVGATAAGAMAASLFFGIVAFILAVLIVISASKGKPMKNAIPKFVSLGMSLVICGCLFAPVLTAKYDLVLSGRRYSKTYTASIDAGGLLTYISPSQAEENGNAPAETYDECMEFIEITLNGMSELTAFEFENQGGQIVTGLLLGVMIVAIGDNFVGALSAGYYVLLLAFILFAAFAVWSIATLFKKSNQPNMLLAVILVLLIAALACSIGWICVLNYHLEGYLLSFTVGGGLIAAIVMVILSLIASGVLARIFSDKKKEPEIGYDDMLAE